MITVNSSLIIQIGNLASARVRIFHGSENLLNGNLVSAEVNEAGGSGTYALAGGGLLRLDIDVEHPATNAALLNFQLTNTGPVAIRFDRMEAPHVDLAQDFSHSPLWSMQGAAVNWGQDFAFELPRGFARDNYLGHVQDGEGGGIPLAYFWKKSQGVALMHVEPSPKDWYLPVKSGKEGVTAALQLRKTVVLLPGESLAGLKTVISIHQGDFFEPLALYRFILAKQGLQSPDPVPANYEPAWCSWGYEFDITPAEMTGVLPVLKELGIRWLTLDDRWFDAYADWNPRADTFPGGAEDMRRMNAQIHAAGGFSQIWWYPLCAEDGHGKWESHTYGVSEILKQHPDWVILNQDGSVARNNRHLAMLCPALPEVKEHVAALTRRFIQDWGFDGHKLDNIYTVPPCYNPAHKHTYPEQATEAMASAYQAIFEITRELRPDSVTQICPCGTPLSLQLIPFTDQTVTADPTSSRQIRQRVKFYKALMGPFAAVFADHVELSDGGSDFASEIGAGGVPSTKFIWPDDEAVRRRLREIWDIPDAKKAEWKKWFDIYNEHRPAQGEYLNLYDLAFDYPESHVIRAAAPGGEDRPSLYYAFYTSGTTVPFSGRVELRGLQPAKIYKVWDYEHEIELGRVSGDQPFLEAAFTGALLLTVREE